MAMLPELPAGRAQNPLSDIARRVLQLRTHRIVPAIEEPHHGDEPYELQDLLLLIVFRQGREIRIAHIVRTSACCRSNPQGGFLRGREIR